MDDWDDIPLSKEELYESIMLKQAEASIYEGSVFPNVFSEVEVFVRFNFEESSLNPACS